MQYRTVIDESAEKLPSMIVSGGRIGSRIELAPQDPAKACGAQFGDILA